jgi:DNA-binding NarL/FixJ family response regulator
VENVRDYPCPPAVEPGVTSKAQEAPSRGQNAIQMSEQGRLRVVLAEPDYLVREGLRVLLSECHGIELVGSYRELAQLRSAVGDHQPDVVLTDAEFPAASPAAGIELLCELAETSPALGLVLLTATANPSWAEVLLSRGADGRAYVLKKHVSSADDLVSVIETVAARRSTIDPDVLDALLKARREKHSLLSDLTRREHEVLAHMATGMSNEAIAQALVLTKRAVEKHINAIFMKLHLARGNGIEPRTKAVVMFLADDHPRASSPALRMGHSQRHSSPLNVQSRPIPIPLRADDPAAGSWRGDRRGAGGAHDRRVGAPYSSESGDDHR